MLLTEPSSAYAPRPVLACANLHKAFGGVHAVQGISLELVGGEVLALLGDNGAGKSTTLKMLAGVLAPDEGEILFDGEPVELKSPKAAKKRGIETVYQDLALANTLDVVQNIFAGREINRCGLIRRQKMETAAAALLKELDVQIPSLSAPVRVLSGGQRQSTAIARAVGWGSRVLLLDEPTAALGLVERSHVLDVINALKQKGIAILIVSHNLPDVYQVADRIAILRRGTLMRVAAVDELGQNEVVSIITGASL